MRDDQSNFLWGGGIGVLIGFLFGLLFISTLHCDDLQKLKREIEYDKSGLIGVKIIEENTGFDQKPWYLIEASDGQRGAISYRRGKVGDKFIMAKDDIDGYRKTPKLPKPGENVEPVSSIVLTPKK